MKHYNNLASLLTVDRFVHMLAHVHTCNLSSFLMLMMSAVIVISCSHCANAVFLCDPGMLVEKQVYGNFLLQRNMHDVTRPPLPFHSSSQLMDLQLLMTAYQNHRRAAMAATTPAVPHRYVYMFIILG